MLKLDIIKEKYGFEPRYDFSETSIPPPGADGGPGGMGR